MCACLTVYLWVFSLWLDLLLPLFDSFLGGVVAANVSAGVRQLQLLPASLPAPRVHLCRDCSLALLVPACLWIFLLTLDELYTGSARIQGGDCYVFFMDVKGMRVRGSMVPASMRIPG